MKILTGLTLVLLLSLSAPLGVRAQEATSVEEVLVTARRTDAPIWEVTRGDSTLILVGAISGVPREIDWRPEALEAATARSQQILFPQVGRASVADVMRLIWRIRTISRLPEGKTTADYLSPEVQRRLDVLMADEKNERWRTQSLVMLSLDLMQERAGYGRKRTRNATDIVQAAAREADVPVRAVGTVRGDEIIDNLIHADPATYALCVERAVSAVEAGPAGAEARITDWRMRRVPQVMDNPLEQALGECWPWGDPEIAPLLRQQWAEAVSQALDAPGVTLAVVQLRVLAEPGGVLDRLHTEGLTIEGPDWKSESQK